MTEIKSRNMAVLLSFVEHCQKHPTERFWQALRNWSAYNFIFVSNRIPADIDHELKDTFYWEGKDK